MLDPDLFHGIAVLIDDEIEDPKASVQQIKDAIKAADCHVVSLPDIPSAAAIASLREVAFFVLDWNLYGKQLAESAGEGFGSPPVPESLAEENEARIIKFLQDLKKVRFAPVFIFTDESDEQIKDVLKQHPDLYDEDDPSHILVKRKQEVAATGLFKILATWMESAPSVYVLKMWERAYQKAKNELFLDFYVRNPSWPIVMWKNFQKDSVPAAPEIGELIGSNLVSRMMPFNCDLTTFTEALGGDRKDECSDDKAVLKVLEGERFLAEDRLDKNSVEPGDIFKLEEGGYRINVRPHCDCIARENSSPDKIKLYLLKGCEKNLSDLDCDSDRGLIREHDNEAVVYPVLEGKALRFGFKDLDMKKWGELKGKRVGRLLPPFLTRLQQRYSSYLQRPGLSRLPNAAFPLSEEAAEPAAAVAASGSEHPEDM